MRSRLAKPIDGMASQARLWIPEREIEASAMSQIHTMMLDPDIWDISIMPDVHAGVGVPIGTIFRSRMVYPTAVGVDIGCGVSFYSGHVNDPIPDAVIREWADEMREYVTYNGEVHRTASRGNFADPTINDAFITSKRRQIGTIGGGNHFVEFLRDVKDPLHYGIAVHSGSRGIGHLVASHYEKLFNEADPEGAKVKLPKLPRTNKIAQSYLTDMDAAIYWARQNRSAMMIKARSALQGRANLYSRMNFETIHNSMSTDQSVMTYRKGANWYDYHDIWGFIPGSMGTKSYVVSPRSDKYRFSSHGAGRVMSRGAAKRAITEEQFAASMGGALTEVNMALVDEAPAAYKDLDMVMSYQDGLVTTMYEFRPVITIKGVK